MAAGLHRPSRDPGFDPRPSKTPSFTPLLVVSLRLSAFSEAEKTSSAEVVVDSITSALGSSDELVPLLPLSLSLPHAEASRPVKESNVQAVNPITRYFFISLSF